MGSPKQKLPLKGSIDLINQLSDDFCRYVKAETQAPEELNYIVKIAKESPRIRRSARTAALQKAQPGFTKVAFDTRRINQEHDRNPRTNLQHWHRSQEFIDEGQQKQIDVYSKLFRTLKNIKQGLGTRPDWHESYARSLHDAVERVLRIKQGDNDIHPSQLAYLDQLLFARYRLNSEDIMKMGSDSLYDRILSKDESLLKRGVLYEENVETNFSKLVSEAVSKTGNQSDKNVINVYSGDSKSNSDSDINKVFATLFGAPNRKDGEKNVERTITISIKDNVIE